MPAMMPHLPPRSKSLVESDGDLAPNSYSLQKFRLYESKARFYLVGRDKSSTRWRVLKIDRLVTSELSICEDPAIYTRQDCQDLLNRLAGGNRSAGGLKFVTKAYGIVGFIKFLEPYYMILVTKRRVVGSICGHAVYGIDESQLLTVPHPSVQSHITMSMAEHRYKKLFTSIDLTKDFFFSYTYRIMWSLQKNKCSGQEERMPYDDMFVWNAFLTRGIRQQIKSLQWTLALIHGFFKQARIFASGNVNCVMTLIARRSRHFAGTRYLKRGVNDKGRVANDVETEQIINEEPWGEMGQISSVIQHRGSIPLFWSQETSILSPKPDIILRKNDPTYEATRLHFQNLAARYGNPIIVLNLVKTVERKPRETILCREFANAVLYINDILPKGNHIKFIQWDFHKFAKRKSAKVLESLGSIATEALELIDVYYSGEPTFIKLNMDHQDLVVPSKSGENDGQNGQKNSMYKEKRRRSSFQHGVLRSNCIDCLDRTNVAQYAFGLAALGRQLHALGLSALVQVDSGSTLAVALMELYQNMGDVLSLQYGGSAAHNKVFSESRGMWKATTRSLEFFRSIRRHYSNAYTDGEKQDAINIFLGHFRPEKEKLALWQLDSDHHLQLRRTGDDPMLDSRTSFKRSYSAGNMLEQSNSSTLSPGEVSRLDHSSIKSTTLSKMGSTLSSLTRDSATSELELKNMMANESFSNLSDMTFEEANPFTLYNKNDMPYKFSDGQCVSDGVDIDWLSSSGNSCEEDVNERHSMISLESDHWRGSGLLGKAVEKAEGILVDPLCTETLGRENTFQEQEDVGSNLKKIMTGGEAIEGFSKTFADWIDGGQIFYY